MKQSKVHLVQSSHATTGREQDLMSPLPSVGWNRLDHGSSAVRGDIKNRTWDTVWQPGVLLLPPQERAVTHRGSEEFLGEGYY